MGVDISEIVNAEQKKLDDFKGKIVAVDGYNILYQFLSIIRQPNGMPLTDMRGRITSHLSGLFYRTANLYEQTIKTIFVFDGKPHEKKHRTIEKRYEIKTKAEEEWKIALQKGDLETARTKAQQTSRLTEEMIKESKELLQYLGIPYIQAISDGEAQASFIAKKGNAFGVSSQDFDSLLFGTPILIRNLAITGKRKLPKKDIYIEVYPELINLENVLKELQISREQLIDLAILVGTDFNEGIKGIGQKKALKLIREKKNLENVFKDLSCEVEDYNEIREIFLNPKVVEDYKIEFFMPNEEKVINFLCREHNFSEERVKNTLKKFKIKKDLQRSLEGWG